MSQIFLHKSPHPHYSVNILVHPNTAGLLHVCVYKALTDLQKAKLCNYNLPFLNHKSYLKSRYSSLSVFHSDLLLISYRTWFIIPCLLGINLFPSVSCGSLVFALLLSVTCVLGHEGLFFFLKVKEQSFVCSSFSFSWHVASWMAGRETQWPVGTSPSWNCSDPTELVVMSCHVTILKVKLILVSIVGNTI